MKRHIFLIVTALFCFMPQAKTHAPVPAEALGLVCCYSSAVFLAFSLQELDDYLKSVYYRNEKYQLYESSKKLLFVSAAVSIASFVALNICYPNTFELPEAVA